MENNTKRHAVKVYLNTSPAALELLRSAINFILWYSHLFSKTLSKTLIKSQLYFVTYNILTDGAVHYCFVRRSSAASWFGPSTALLRRPEQYLATAHGTGCPHYSCRLPWAPDTGLADSTYSAACVLQSLPVKRTVRTVGTFSMPGCIHIRHYCWLKL